MWWMWPHFKRIWAGAGAVIVGLTVTWLYSVLSEQALPHLQVASNLLHDYWPWFGGALLVLAAVSVVAERAYRRHAAQAPRPLRTTRSSLRTLLDRLGAPFRSSPAPVSSKPPKPPLIGRDAELARLREWFMQAQGGSRHVVFVSGEPGVGKTTLIAAFLDGLASDRSVRIARGECVAQHGAAEPFMPMFEALTRLCREPSGAHLIGILHQLAPTWLAQMPSLVSVEDRDRLQRQTQGAAQSRMLREMVEAVETIAAETPLILLLEDLHWSDPSTLDLIAALARRTGPAHLLILGTCRPTEGLPEDHPLRTLMVELRRHRHCAELSLQPLSEEEIAAYRTREQADEPRSEDMAPTTAFTIGKRTTLVAGLGLIAFVIVIYGIANWKRSAPGLAETSISNLRTITSIAVLPLDNFTGDPNQEYFSDGMTDELTTDLAKISALRVISRGSVMQYKGAHRPPTPEIAKALNVDAVVEGSVTRIGDKVRITAQLIDARADKHLWAENYERDARDVLAMQDDVTLAIAKEINVQLTPNEQAHLANSRAVNPEAHEAYLRGRYYEGGWSPETLNKAIEQFNRAIKLDLNFALPYAGLADAYSDADDLYTSPSLMPQAKAAAERALQLDDSLAEAHASLGYVNFLYDYDLAAAESQYRRAIELRPNYANAHFYYGFLLGLEGRFDEAIAEGRQASDLDPLSASVATFASFPFTFEGKYDTARAMVQQGLDLYPTSDAAQWQLGFIDLEAGNFARAIVELEKARRPDAIPYVEGWIGYAYAASGDRVKALATIKELDKASSRRYVSPFSTAMIYLALGDKERALAGLEKTYEVHSQWLFLLKVDKIFDPLRSDPRFIALLKKVHLDK